MQPFGELQVGAEVLHVAWHAVTVFVTIGTVIRSTASESARFASFSAWAFSEEVLFH